MDAENTTTDTKIQPPAKAEHDLQKEYDGYARMAKIDAENAAFKALPFIGARVRHILPYWAPPKIRGTTFAEKDIAYETGRMYAKLLALHCRNYKTAHSEQFTNGLVIKQIIEAASECGVKHPRKGAELRAGFLQELAEFALTGMLVRR